MLLRVLSAPFEAALTTRTLSWVPSAPRRVMKLPVEFELSAALGISSSPLMAWCWGQSLCPPLLLVSHHTALLPGGIRPVPRHLPAALAASAQVLLTVRR